MVACAVAVLVVWPSSAPADVLEDGSWRVDPGSGSSYYAFGQCTAVFDDLLLVGSPRDTGRGDGQGEANLYQFIDGDWEYLQAFAESSASWSFGTSVDMDASRIVIGSPNEANGNGGTGVVYIYVNGPSGWEFDGVLSSDSLDDADRFGHSLSLDGNFLAVGEPGYDDGSADGNHGRASIWRLGVNGSSFMLQTAAPDQQSLDRMFGWSIDLEGSILAVGGPSIEASSEDGGRAWVFRKDGDYYQQEAELSAPDASSDETEQFGYSVALDGTRLAVGRPGKALDATHPRNGSVHLFLDDGSFWLHEQELTPQEVGSQRMGTSIDITGGVLVAGMPGDAESGSEAGAVAIHERLKSGWERTARIKAIDGQLNAEFGHAVSMDGDRIAVGAPSFKGETSIRAVYIYDSADGWQQIPEAPVVPTLFADITLAPPSPVDGANFGYKVAHDGNWAVAASRPGTISFLRRFGSNWTVMQEEKISAGLITSVAIDQDWAVIGVGADTKFEHVMLFDRDGSGIWSLIHSFMNPDSMDETFGATVDLNRNNERVAVGSPGSGSNGAVHTYALLGGNWQVMTIVPDARGEGEGGGGTPSQLFGQELDLLGSNWLAVGAPGEAGSVGNVYLYNLVGGVWNPYQQIVDPGIPLFRGVSDNPMFGKAISLNFDGNLFIGAPLQSLNSDEGQAGLVHRFMYNPATGFFEPEEIIMPIDPTSGSMFGWDLDHRGDQMVIAEPFADDAGANAGRIWLYEQFEVTDEDGPTGETNWVPVAKLVSDGPLASDALGHSVSLGDGDLLTGVVSGENVGSDSGRIKVFQTPFLSMWTRLQGGSMDDPGAWVPEPPSASRAAVFSNWGAGTYDLFLGETSDVTAIRVGLDTVTGYPAKGGSVLGSKSDPVSFQIGCPADLGSSGVILAEGELTIVGSCTLGTPGVTQAKYGDFAGFTQLNDDAMLTVDGTWAQSKLGRLSMTVAKGMSSRLNISDTPSFGGTLAVQGSVADLPVKAILPLIDSSLQSGPLVDRFDLALLPGLPGNRAFILHQGAAERGSAVVWLEVIDLADLVNFDDGDPYAVDSNSTAVLVEDLDGDGYQEVAVVLGGLPGSVNIFYNDQFGGLGTQVSYEVGNEPAGIAAGDFDDDGDIDLAVSNFGDDTVDILRNDGTGLFAADVPPLPVGAGPLGLGARDLDLNGTSDLLVCCSEEREIQVYSGASLRGSRAPSQKIPTDGKPGSIDPADYDKEKGGDVGATTVEPGMLITMSVGASGTLGDPLGHPAGPKPGNIKSKDVDDDGEADFVASDDEEGTVTVLKQSSSLRGYEAPLTLPVAESTGAITLLDIDQDGDQDIAVAATLVDGTRVVKMLRNDTELYGGSILVFTDAEDLDSPNEIQLVASGDLDLDGIDDLVTIGERIVRGDTSSTLDVHRNPSCTGDVNGDLVVDILDLLEVISQWGACKGACGPDFNLDGRVDILDLLAVISSWGPCGSK